jgi:hypothetical protein
MSNIASTFNILYGKRGCDILFTEGICQQGAEDNIWTEVTEN